MGNEAFELSEPETLNLKRTFIEPLAAKLH